MKTRKVGILGLGHVGAHVAYSLAIQGIAAELVLVDPKESKLAAEVQDLRDAILYCPHDVKINGGTYADLGDCDAIVNCIGDIDLVASGDRLDELTFTAAQVKGYITRLWPAASTASLLTSPILACYHQHPLSRKRFAERPCNRHRYRSGYLPSGICFILADWRFSAIHQRLHDWRARRFPNGCLVLRKLQWHSFNLFGARGS